MSKSLEERVMAAAGAAVGRQGKNLAAARRSLVDRVEAARDW